MMTVFALQKCRHHLRAALPFIVTQSQQCSSRCDAMKTVIEEHKVASSLDERIPKILSQFRIEELMQLRNQEDRLKRLLIWGRRDMKKNTVEEEDKVSSSGNSYTVLSQSYLLFRRMSDLHRGYSDPKLIRNWQLNDSPRLVIDLHREFDDGPSASFTYHDMAKIRVLTKALSANRAHRFPAKMFLLSSELTAIPNGSSDASRTDLLHKSLIGYSLHDGIAFRSVSRLDDATRQGPGSPNVVYINHKARNVVRRLDGDTVYVLDGLGNRSTFVHKRAVDLRVKEARLPVNQFVRSINMRRLSLDRLVSLLLDVFITGDWAAAIERHVPPIVTKQYPAGFVTHRTHRRRALRSSSQELLAYLR